MKQRRARFALLALVAIALSACGGGDSAGSGEAAKAADARRTVDVTISQAKQYQPGTITVAPGEVVTFNITNASSELHEFMVGDAKAHDAHEKEMSEMSMGSMKMADKPDYVDIDPGKTKQLTWKFPSKSGTTVIYGSHIPGDYTGGLKGTVTVSG